MQQEVVHMKQMVMVAMLAGGALFCAAAPNDWENLQVNSRNREPARTYSMPLDRKSVV